MDRRTFLSALSGPLFAACDFKDGVPEFKGEVLGPAMALGHRLRNNDFPAPTETRKLDIAIVGGGVSGLSAAWRLTHRGIKSFKLFELEGVLGGNARSGSSVVTPYPWGAHYLPLPTRESVHVRALLADLGVLKSGIDSDTPLFDERAIVNGPQDRLYRNGLWQEGLLPRMVAPKELDQYKRFDDMIERFRQSQDLFGNKPFAIPSLLASRDLRFTAPDATDMRRWMVAQGFDSPALHWYVDYACRDDFGSLSRDTSAWAGLHYFASREGRAQNADSHAVLTWPEGNGFLTRRTGEWLSERVSEPFVRNALCTRLVTSKGFAEIDIFHADQNRSVRYRCKRVIWAAPSFVLARVWDNPPPAFRPAVAGIETVPWLVANLHLRTPPADTGPAPLAWDNVLYNSNALGYVVATHQTMRVRPGATVLTYYWPHSGEAPAAARKRLFETPWSEWIKAILADLKRPHPEIAKSLERIEIWRWGHAMPQPSPGFLTAPARAALGGLKGSLVFAHADLSGMSLFEEANYAGVRAANMV
jgi:protoporphyrinogen oxidase